MNAISQFRPHHNAAFESYYSNFQLLDGSRIIVVVCAIRDATERPYMISFTYCPKEYKTKHDVYQKEIWVKKLDMIDGRAGTRDPLFMLRFDCGRVCFYHDHTDYQIRHPDLKLFAWIDNEKRVRWLGQRLDTPEGLFALLPLPQHWQVYSLASPASLSLDVEDSKDEVHPISKSFEGAYVHQEKNWASSFPLSHVWIQARTKTRSEEVDKPGMNSSGLCVAGGRAFGLETYFLSYHSTDSRYSTFLRPPLSTLLFPTFPSASYDPTAYTTTTTVDYDTRTVHLELLTSILPPYRKISIHATAPPESFFPLPAPSPDGHRPNHLTQSMRSTVTVKVYEIEEQVGLTIPVFNWRLSYGTHWKCVHEDVFDNAGLEFGGEYYADRG